MENPKVSFIIPCYNAARYIEPCIRSACAQDYPSYEVIVVNDGSVDCTEKIVSELQKNYDFIFVTQENQGVCGAMNRGLNLARGDYFCWGGHDDVFHTDRLKLHADFLDKNLEYAACYSNIKYIDENGHEIGFGKTRHLKSGWILDALYRRCFIPAPASMVRTKILHEVGGFDNRYIVEDYPLWLKIEKDHPIAFVDAVVTDYRLHESNLSGAKERFYVGIQKILEDFSDDAACRKALKYWYRRWFCDASKGDSSFLTQRYLKKLQISDFFYPRVLKSYIRYRARKG
jgi:alpha-1,6-rhamnosyltransferase/alpha-1,3-rhamnosyltransferase